MGAIDQAESLNAADATVVCRSRARIVTTRVGLYFGKGELKKEVASAVAGDIAFRIPARARSSKQTLLSVPAYDFNWQLYYYPKTPVSLPRGSIVEAVAHYDNSADNPHNPDPARDVTFGEALVSRKRRSAVALMERRQEVCFKDEA